MNAPDRPAPRPWPDAAEAVELPLEELAMHVLARLAASDFRGNFPLRSGQIVGWVQEWAHAKGDRRAQSEVLQSERVVARALGEAWDWLCSEGLLARAVMSQGNPEAFFVTRHGRETLEYLEPLDMLRAQRRLGVELHPRLADRLRPLTRAGAFEQAAFDALREVEVRVRELAGEVGGAGRAEGRIGVGLMRYAFGDEGPRFATPEYHLASRGHRTRAGPNGPSRGLSDAPLGTGTNYRSGFCTVGPCAVPATRA